MSIDPKFLKPKLKGHTVLGTFTAPIAVIEYLQSRGVNISAVCRDAVEQAIEVGEVASPDLKRYSFKAPEALLKRASKDGINVSGACAKALEALYMELKGARRGK